MSIFDYARNKIRKKYAIQLTLFDDKESIKRREYLEKHEIFDIDWYEEKSKQGLVDAIIYRFKAFWQVQTGDEKFLIGVCIAVMALSLLCFCFWIPDTPLNIIILKISEGFSLCFAILSVIWLCRWIRNRCEKRRVFYVIWALYFILSLPRAPILLGYESTQIGDFYEAREYTEEYYVIFSRKPQSNTNRKQYMLPAQIERRLDYSGTTESGYDKHDLNYHINYLYFSNGGYLSFDYDRAYEEPSYTSVVVGQEAKVYDYKGDTYYITLTDEKVNQG
jgi:hypothetical protein